jgi:hypothetical protein
MALSFFTTTAVTPLVDVALAAINATVLRHAGHMSFLFRVQRKDRARR